MKTAHELKVEYLQCRVAYLTLIDELDRGVYPGPTRMDISYTRKAAFDAEMAMLKSELALLTNSD